MSNGFLGFNASFMLDFVVCALVAVVPTILFSLYLVKVKKNYTAHRNVQLALAVILLRSRFIMLGDSMIITSKHTQQSPQELRNSALSKCKR